MLNQKAELTASSNPGRVIWTEDEWDRIAAELKKRHPEKNLSRYDQINFTMEQFEDAMEAVLAQERQKSYRWFSDVKSKLFDAFKRLSDTSASQKPTKVTSINKGRITATGHILWSPDEWELVCLELHRLYPNAFSERLAKINLAVTREAQGTLDHDRRRNFQALELFRTGCLKTWEALPSDVKNPELQDRTIVEFPNGLVMEPVTKKADSESAMATAIHKAFHPNGRKINVHWKHKDYMLLAAEMHRQNPHAGFLDSQLVKIDLDAVRSAQREALTQDRHRKLINSYGLREPLLEAFRMLKLQLEEQKRTSENTAAETKADDKVFDIEDEQQENIPEGFHAIPVLNTPPEAKNFSFPVNHQTAPSDFNTRLAAAATPLISLFMSELGKALAPELAKAFAPMIDAVVDAVKKIPAPTVVHQTIQAPPPPPQVAQFSEKAVAEVIATTFAPPAEPVKKPKIVVLGPFGKDKDGLEKAFPEYRFTLIEHSHGIKEAAVNAELFVCSYFAMTEKNKGIIKKCVNKEKVRFVDGGINGIKRQIQIWKDSHKVLEKH